MPLMKMTPKGEVAMTAQEEAEFLADQASAIKAEATERLIAQAKALLNASDAVFIRCGKAGVSWPPAWQSYVHALRAIATSGTGAIPPQPDYPATT